MPVVVGSPTPPAATPVVSSDGVLTVTPDPLTASFLVDVNVAKWNHTGTDFTSAGLASSCTVTRGDGSAVRGLDGAVAFGGVASGIDHEPTLGVPTVYTATLTGGGGSWRTGAVSVTMPRPGNARMWIKSLDTPALSVQVRAQSYPDQGGALPVGQVQGDLQRFPSVSAGVWQPRGGSLSVFTEDDAAEVALTALLASGGPMLLQYDSAFDPNNRRDVYAYVTAGVWPFETVQPFRTWTLTVVPMQRPATTGSVVDLPGGAWADLPDVSWSELPDVSWAALPLYR